MRPGKVRKLFSKLRVLRRTGEGLLAILAFLFGGLPEGIRRVIALAATTDHGCLFLSDRHSPRPSSPASATCHCKSGVPGPGAGQLGDLSAFGVLMVASVVVFGLFQRWFVRSVASTAIKG